VAGEVPLVGPHALARDDSRAGLELDDLVDQEEGVAVREDFLDLCPC
jgi:hypothetical protein